MGYFPVRYDSRVVIYERKMFIGCPRLVFLPNCPSNCLSVSNGGISSSNVMKIHKRSAHQTVGY